MTPTECLKIFAAVHGLCPAMKSDEHTPDLWEQALIHLPYNDTEAAVVRLARKLRFIGPADICTEVRAIRKERLDAMVEPVPDADPDDVAGYICAIREGRYRSASAVGRPRPVERALASVGQALALPPSDLRRAIAPSVRRLEDLPKWVSVSCPKCGAEPGDLCTIPESVPVVKRQDPHASRRHLAHPPPPEAEKAGVPW